MNLSAITQALPPGGATGLAATSTGADDFAAAVAREQADAGLERVDGAGGTGSGSPVSAESPRETPGSSEGDSSAAAAAELEQPQTAPSLPDIRPMPDADPAAETLPARPGEQTGTTAPRSGHTLPGEPRRTDLTEASLIIDRGAHTLPAVRPEQSVIDNGAQTLPAIRPELPLIDNGARALPAGWPGGSPAAPPVNGTLPEGEAWPTGVTAQAAPASTAAQPLVSPQASASPSLSPQASASPSVSAPAQTSTAPLATTASAFPVAGDAVPAQHPIAGQSALRATDRIVAEPTAFSAPAVAPTAASAPASAAAPATPASAPAPPPLLTQLSQPVVALARAGAGEHRLTITVSPDDLGPVTVHARIGADGIRIELHAPSDAGRDALRGLLADLRRDLAATAPQSSLHLGDGEGGQRSTDQRSAGQHGAGPDSGERDAAGHEPGSSVPTPVVQAAAAAAASPPTVRTPHSGIDLYA